MNLFGVCAIIVANEAPWSIQRVTGLAPDVTPTFSALLTAK